MKWISTQVIRLSAFWRIHLERRSFAQVQRGGRHRFHYDPSGDFMSASVEKKGVHEDYLLYLRGKDVIILVYPVD